MTDLPNDETPTLAKVIKLPSAKRETVEVAQWLRDLADGFEGECLEVTINHAVLVVHGMRVDDKPFVEHAMMTKETDAVSLIERAKFNILSEEFPGD